jgi:DNA polymerase III epsilon subunit-like protein
MYTFLDFEFNQAFDFPDAPTAVNENCRFEIIQIGAVRMDKDLNITDRLSIMIKPVVYPRMHPYVEKITGITADDLKDKPFFPEAYKEFRKFIEGNKLLCTWGTSDIRALYRNMIYHNVAKPPIRIEYIDVQGIATRYLKFSHGGNIGLKNAVEALELPIDEQFHDACCDALYTARVFKAIHPDKPEIKIFNSTHLKKK